MGPAAVRREGMWAAEWAIEIARSLSFGHSMKALLLVFASDRDHIDEALACARLSYDLDPHSMAALTALSFIEIVSGEPERAIEHHRRGARLRAALRTTPSSACTRRRSGRSIV